MQLLFRPVLEYNNKRFLDQNYPISTQLWEKIYLISYINLSDLNTNFTRSKIQYKQQHCGCQRVPLENESRKQVCQCVVYVWRCQMSCGRCPGVSIYLTSSSLRVASSSSCISFFVSLLAAAGMGEVAVATCWYRARAVSLCVSASASGSPASISTYSSTSTSSSETATFYHYYIYYCRISTCKLPSSVDRYCG